MKFTLRLKHGYHSAQDAMVVFAKGISTTGAVVCVQEFHAWARYHHDYELVSVFFFQFMHFIFYVSSSFNVILKFYTGF